jgi:DNA-binding NarL/FixJ family response regulator
VAAPLLLLPRLVQHPGLTNRQIAARLYLAEKTVKNYVSSLLHKLGFERRTEAAVYAAKRKQTPPHS